MMARHKKRIEKEAQQNHDRWLVSYADFITLLFAFFVVMYSISSLNNAKYESLSAALDEAFSPQENTIKNQEVIEKYSVPTVIQPIILDNPTTEEKKIRKQLSEEILRERRHLSQVSDNLEAVLEPYVDKKLVSIKKRDFWVELEMNSQLLFLSGEAELSVKAIPVLKKIAEVIRRLPNVVNVEGYTDNIPIDTVEFPSNWDLSSARATSVVRELINDHIPPIRLSAVGYGEFHPVADNHTEAGRFKNRRVVLVLMSEVFSRYGMTDEKRAELLNIKRQSDSFATTVTSP